jgi:5-methylcytosine-specific restriction protein A
MSQRARRICVDNPRCPDVAVEGERYCATHLQQRLQRRPSSHARGYDNAWALFSRRWLALHRWCGERADFTRHAEHSRCAQQHLPTRAEVTDHIRALNAHGAKYDTSNLQSLCRACHNRKTIAHDGGFVSV